MRGFLGALCGAFFVAAVTTPGRERLLCLPCSPSGQHRVFFPLFPLFLLCILPLGLAGLLPPGKHDFCLRGLPRGR